MAAPSAGVGFGVGAVISEGVVAGAGDGGEVTVNASIIVCLSDALNPDK